MSWTRRWGIISCLALAQLGLIVNYQAFLSGGPAPARAEAPAAQTSQPPAPKAPESSKQESPENVALEPATMPPIPVPVLPPLPALEVPATLPLGEKDAVSSPQLPAFPSPAIPSAASQLPGPAMIIPIGAKEVESPLPAAVQVPVAPAAPLCPWSLQMEIVDGRTQLTAQNGKDVKFTVSCEKLVVQTPSGSIHASGAVKLATPSIDGACDQLTISWQNDVVVLDKVQLKCKLEGQEAELHADQMRLRLSNVVTVSERGTATPILDGSSP
jgi:hypothetical protein